ncbi:hypothetical protein [Metabacillus halosaccharovorans]|uniref:hypothetical protein n=1 Tax=Metabacillus halosaccharovorans TaxID=930124 RepID=UPI000994993B|nr:hypothetical protein [Metabacillus halosaccharovorans]
MRMLAALFLLTSIFLAGCGTDVSQNTNEPTEENAVEEKETTDNNEEVTETEEPQENTEEVTEEPTEEETTEGSTEEGTAEENTEEPEIMKESEAIYIGQADTHSIEIETADQETVIFQTLESDVDFDSIKEGSKVNIDYYIDENGQNILKSIAVLN